MDASIAPIMPTVYKHVRNPHRGMLDESWHAELLSMKGAKFLNVSAETISTSVRRLKAGALQYSWNHRAVTFFCSFAIY